MPEKILIIDDDVDTLKLVGLMLQRQGYEISAASNGEQGLVKAFAEKPDVILLDLMMPDMDGYEVARRLRKNPPTHGTPILMFTAKTQLDDKVAGFEVGADDYLTKPTHPAELQSHVRSLLARGSAGKRDETESTERGRRGHTVAVLAARDGLGVSTLASNLAGAFFARNHSDVILAELTPGRGTLGMDLGTPNPRGQSELLSGTAEEITPEKVASLLVPHGSGLRLLLASENPLDVSRISQTRHFERLFSCLAALAPFIVLDLGSGLPPFAEKILPLCDDRIVVTEGSPNTIAHTRILLDEIVAMGVDQAAITVVLNNRIRADAQMPWTEVQQSLGHAVSATLTPAPELLIAAARRYMPAVLAQPANITAQQILKLADEIQQRENAK
jgi:CheY-like chemotaxis protein/MinD-like ATPase involved in chromosome partitioning or flagellar assembly